MRKPIIAGNWKMNTTLGEAKELASRVKVAVDKIKGVDKIKVRAIRNALPVGAGAGM